MTSTSRNNVCTSQRDSGQTRTVHAVPAKTAAAKFLKFLKSSTFKRKLKTFTQNVGFVCLIYIDNLLIVIQPALLPRFRFANVFFSRQRNLEMALLFLRLTAV